MRNGGFRISSWTGLCAGSASIQLIGRQLKFQLSSSFNLLEQCCTTLVSVGSENILKQLHSYSAWSKEHGSKHQTHTHMCVCVSTSDLLPRLWFQHYYCLLCGPFLQRQTPKQCNKLALRNSTGLLQPSWIYTVYIYIINICIVSALSAKNKKAYDVCETSQFMWI